jgi:hypothetical protein
MSKKLKPIRQEQLPEVAGAFVSGMLADFGFEALAKAARANRREKNKQICHSHDFCDANEYMLRAFRKVCRVEMATKNRIEAPESTAAWNDAWDMGKAIINLY